MQNGLPVPLDPGLGLPSGWAPRVQGWQEGSFAPTADPGALGVSSLIKAAVGVSEALKRPTDLSFLHPEGREEQTRGVSGLFLPSSILASLCWPPRLLRQSQGDPGHRGGCPVVPDRASPGGAGLLAAQQGRANRRSPYHHSHPRAASRAVSGRRGWVHGADGAWASSPSQHTEPWLKSDKSHECKRVVQTIFLLLKYVVDYVKLTVSGPTAPRGQAGLCEDRSTEPLGPVLGDRTRALGCPRSRAGGHSSVGRVVGEMAMARPPGSRATKGDGDGDWVAGCGRG